MKLKNKNIILCITGSIAAYKAVFLASFLKKEGANVYAVLTKNALQFITPLTLKTITGNKVTIDMFDESDYIAHISLSKLADIVLVAPATANIMAKAATGIADDMVSTLLISAKAKKIIVPSMNINMYLNPMTQNNICILKKHGFEIMEPDKGKLACGAEGVGRFPEIEKIYDFLLHNIDEKEQFFKNKKILITTGGTIEDIDPVRFISNRSSGKMGLAFAEEFICRGGNVTIIAGNVSDLAMNNFKNKYSNVKIVFVRSAIEMKEAVLSLSNDFDIYLMAAAVADYTMEYNKQKIKKQGDSLALNLKKTDDILEFLPKRDNALYIGFAAETVNILKNARDKLNKKGLDLLIANQVNGDKSAIGGDRAEAYLLNKWDKKEYKFNYNEKQQIASSVVDKIIELIRGQAIKSIGFKKKREN